MARGSRDKGLRGEREVAALFKSHGFTVRGLESEGDHLILLGATERLMRTGERRAVALHSEVKRCETARPWAWIAQAEREAPPGAVPVVSFRRSHSKWYAIIGLDDLARLLS